MTSVHENGQQITCHYSKNHAGSLTLDLKGAHISGHSMKLCLLPLFKTTFAINPVVSYHKEHTLIYCDMPLTVFC